MSKKDVFDIIIGCVAWVVVILLSVLTCCGILDFDKVWAAFSYIIAMLGMLLVFLLLLWMSLKK